MRKITIDAVEAFFNGKDFKRSNTIVVTDEAGTMMFLHGNLIAEKINDMVIISCAGWCSNTTKERLNGILSYLDLDLIRQKDFVWYMGDKEFNTSDWNRIK